MSDEQLILEFKKHLYYNIGSYGNGVCNGEILFDTIVDACTNIEILDKDDDSNTITDVSYSFDESYDVCVSRDFFIVFKYKQKLIKATWTWNEDMNPDYNIIFDDVEFNIVIAKTTTTYV